MAKTNNFSFLQLVASDIYQKFKDELANIVIIFPNNRARLFFNEALFNAGKGKPIWSPAYLTITELIKSQSNLKIADSLKLINDLYLIYCKETGSTESLDEFYFWGEILLNDFDDIDKNLTNAKQLFTNVEALNEFQNDFNNLEAEQKEALKRFFLHFDPQKSELKKRFAAIWNHLYSIYSSFNQCLVQQGLAYEGMIYREAADKVQTEKNIFTSYSKYILVGFNILNESEKQLFLELRKREKALFYWDYDLFYMEKPQHEAATYLRQNMLLFPNQLSEKYFNAFREIPKETTIITSPTANAQARYISTWIQELQKKGSFKPSSSAIVLCDESLLLSVVHSIPTDIDDINITMGFPLSQTPIYTLIRLLIDLQIQGYNHSLQKYRYTYILPLLRHSYITTLSHNASDLEKEMITSNIFFLSTEELALDSVLKTLFTPIKDSKELAGYLLKVLTLLSSYYAKKEKEEINNEESDTSIAETTTYQGLHYESLFRTYTLINQMYSLLYSESISLKLVTFSRLIQQVLSRATVPFNGEPVHGLQVMGLLETRNLDFENILILSVNEGNLPQSSNGSSFIPFLLRKAFKMTTVEHNNSLYAYYFFRLLQRCSNITFLYNTSTDGLNKGEKSRFLLQLLCETQLPIQQKEICSTIQSIQPIPIQIAKDTTILKQLKETFDYQINQKSILSPTALNAFIDCPLKFFFHYIAKLSTDKETTEEIDNAMFGTIFHKCAELIYKDFFNRKEPVHKDSIKTLLKNQKKLEEIVDQAFSSEFFKQKELKKPNYNGAQFINRKVIIDFLKNLLYLDKDYAPFSILGTEKKITSLFQIETQNSPIEVQLGGTIDRLDIKESVVRVIDYKTGGHSETIPDIDSLFIPSEKRSKYAFQAFLYSILLKKEGMEYSIVPQLLYIHRMRDKENSLHIKVNDIGIIEDISCVEKRFMELLTHLIENLFNPEIPFTQTSIEKNCLYCDFKNICRK